MLDHIHIENYRLFKKLDIDKVGQVNLITGKNNSGKSTLLEALRIYRNGALGIEPYFDIFSLILKERGEKDSNVPLFEAFMTLYHEWKSIIENGSNNFIINNLKISLDFEGLTISLIDKEISKRSLNNAFSDYDDSIYIPVNFNLLNPRFWKNIELTDKEDKVAEILQIIEPNIIRVSFNEADGIAKVRLRNSHKPLPFRNLGEGINHLLSIALGLFNAENDILLIEEIDLRLHHSIQPLLWDIVFRRAIELNVQIFATTHSLDCVRAFSFIANKPEYTGIGNYIRLQRSKKDDNIIAVDYDMEQLETAMAFNLKTR